MNAFTEWLSAAPQGAIAVITGLLAAAVAIIVTFITQWILGRRARTELLTKKLEELYLVLNEVSAHNVNRVEAALPLVTSTPFEKTNITGSSIERQALDHHKKNSNACPPVLSSPVTCASRSLSSKQRRQHAHP